MIKFIFLYLKKGIVADLLIKAGADVNARDNDNSTPLHAAVWFGKPQMIELLIKNGASVNAQDHLGNTPLHAAVAVGDADKQFHIAELLLNNGADVNLKNAEGQTPLDLAEYEKSKATYDRFFLEFISLNQLFSFFFCS